MSENEDLLEKVVSTTLVSSAAGGLLNADQADTFIDYMWDATVLAKEGRIVRMKSNTADIDKVNVGTRIARLATEAVDDGVNADPTFSKISLTTKKLRLDWEISTESLEDNIEGRDLEDHIVRMMATQFGNDIEDLAINGDTGSADPLLKSFDGFRKGFLANGHVVSATSPAAGATPGVFNLALKNMPRKYLQRRNQLKFYAGSNVLQDYLNSLLTQSGLVGTDIVQNIYRGNPQAPSGPAGTVIPNYAYGIPILEVPLFPETTAGSYSGASGGHGAIELTFPNNRLWGIKRDIQVFNEFKRKKDTTEYTVYVRIGVQVENYDASVVVTNVKVQ